MLAPSIKSATNKTEYFKMKVSMEDPQVTINKLREQYRDQPITVVILTGKGEVITGLITLITDTHIITSDEDSEPVARNEITSISPTSQFYECKAAA